MHIRRGVFFYVTLPERAPREVLFCFEGGETVSERVALIGDNSVEYIGLLFDIWNQEGCAVLIDPQTPVTSAIEMMHDANVKKCYIEHKYYLQICNHIADETELIPYYSTSNTTQLLMPESYKKFKACYSKSEAVIIYSSGTTGKSKGIILSHYALNTNANAIIDYMRPRPDDRLYIIRNLTHSSTITGELLVAAKAKIPILISPVKVPPRYVFNNIAKYLITIIGLNPLLLSMYAGEYSKGGYDIPTLRKVYVSGSILNDKIYNMAHKTFPGIELYNVYGLSEAAPRVSAQQKECSKSNSVGKPISGVKVAIVDDNGLPVPKGVRGIVHVSTPSIFDGYVCGQLKHASKYQGWLNTGDVGYFDENDELHIDARVDDMLIIGAHKIYPAEIEKRIISCADVNECAVTAVSHHDAEILCCLYVADQEITADIINRLEGVLIKYEIPKIFLRTDAIPRTTNGKISHKLVQDLFVKKLDGGSTWKNNK